ncbi:modification methylase [Campylobacter jejuni]|uniref:Site-specific DNA-methyltransferase (adenine-specific) n=1 Tax=Campylobacter jejuni TaxID=197 RepID=A0A431C5T4_CAMJU|nr:Dam family site-specific DNA-(adenine-N6)-methyltransferase [Campylobacter jejuni]ECL3018551.1 Dam family site-specific DNA-(adenine-N6)-methyltransferase [Campylobacter jejuni]RTJ08744.1 modification methylase [Campylobacter jejuni]RTJ13518.1 modification methylase [Campylobacter jejuni]RTJ41824.1 modification methylase [Campylobacter jejuni]RTJ48914.1 modification methylase [Campylobacter jejuni]
MEYNVKPFLKWVGGKSNLLREIRNYYPFDNKIIKYAEPFVGGGSVLFDILNRYELESIYISDLNKDLIDVYNVIKNNVNDLLLELELLQNNFLKLDKNYKKDFFYQKRKLFNELKIISKLKEKDNIKKASLMIFLNKTCYNGLYRVNKKNLFNVPLGSYKKPIIFDQNNLISLSKRIRNISFLCKDYKKSSNFIDENTFVYLDPPYRPISQTSNFVNYTEFSFDDKKQKELSCFINKIHKKGAKFLLSNSDPKNVNKNDNFFEKLYIDYSINKVDAKRSINSKSNSRKTIKELLITNI